MLTQPRFVRSWVRTGQGSRWLVLAACISAGCATGRAVPPDHAGARPARPRGTELVKIAEVFAEHGDRVRAMQYLTFAQRDGVPARDIVPRLLALYAADGQYRLAIDTAQSHLRRHPDDLQIRSCLGALYIAVDATAEALLAYELVVQQAPNDAEAHYALASILADSGTQRERADHHYRAYLTIAPSGRYAHEARSKLLKELKP